VTSADGVELIPLWLVIFVGWKEDLVRPKEVKVTMERCGLFEKRSVKWNECDSSSVKAKVGDCGYEDYRQDEDG
jgi:hypothetical protein